LLAPALMDEKPDTMDAKDLRELSAKAIGGSHPGVLLLYPNEKPEETPKLADKGNNTWVLMLKEPVTVNGQKADGRLGIDLTLDGYHQARMMRLVRVGGGWPRPPVRKMPTKEGASAKAGSLHLPRQSKSRTAET